MYYIKCNKLQSAVEWSSNAYRSFPADTWVMSSDKSWEQPITISSRGEHITLYCSAVTIWSHESWSSSLWNNATHVARKLGTTLHVNIRKSGQPTIIIIQSKWLTTIQVGRHCHQAGQFRGNKLGFILDRLRWTECLLGYHVVSHWFRYTHLSQWVSSLRVW